MRKLRFASVALLVAVLGYGPVVLSQRDSTKPKPGMEVPLVTPGPGWKTCPRCMNDGHVAEFREKAKVDTRKFDPHDISGIWSGALDDFGANGTPLDLQTMPPYTPYGQKLYDATLSDSQEWNTKDPVNGCNPYGIPRNYSYNYGIEFKQLPGRTVEFFEVSHMWRDIWTDGRKLPAEPPMPRFYGYAVGRWDGDYFVVESNGYDDRSWLTQQGRRNAQGRPAGSPHSDEMRITERYKRLNYGLLQMEITITDPKVFTAPWHSGPHSVLLIPESEIGEHICVPSDSVEYYDRQQAPAAEKEK